MAYDGEIRLKAVVDKSGVVDLEADLGEVEKKAGDAEKAVQDIKLDDSTEKSAKRAAGGVQDLARETRKATEETQRLNQAMQDTERHRNTKIHMNNGQVFDWGGNLVEDASRNTDEMEAAQERLSATAQKTEQAMRSMAEETQKVNEASQGLGDNAADGIEQQLTPTQNMIDFIKKSFQDIPEMFGILKEKVSSVLQPVGNGLGDADAAELRRTEKTWDNLNQKAEYYKRIMENLGKKGQGFGNSAYDKMYIHWQEAEQAIKDYKAQLINTGQKQLDLKRGIQQVGEESKKTYRKMNQGTKKTGSLFSTMASRLKGIMLSLLIFNWISKAFNAMISGMKTGFANLMGYSNEYANTVQSLKNAMSTLGNSFAAAFAPIVSMVIPWLTQLINAIAKAISYIGQFFAILGGNNTFVRAKQIQDSYNSSLNKTGSAAKKAAGALAKFDDLDVLQKQDSSGGGASGTQPKDMFEEVPVDEKMLDWWDKLKEKMLPVLDYLKELKDAFMDGFWDGLGDYQYRFDAIKKGLEQIKTAILDIWNDPDVRTAADAWAKSLMYMLGSLVGSVASIGLTIAAAFIGGIGQYLEDNTERIKQFLISCFNIGREINEILAQLFQSIAYIFEAFASEEGIQFMAALIGSIADAAMGLAELALRIGRDFLDMLTRPIIENAEAFKTALEGLLGSAATVLEGIKETIDQVFDHAKKVYDSKIHPLFESIASGLSEIVGILLDAWNGSVQPVLDSLAEKISELLTQYITPFLNTVIDVIGSIAECLQTFWESVLQPLFEWIVAYAVPFIVDFVSTSIEVIISVVEVLIGALTAFIDFIKDTVLKWWKDTWKSAEDVFKAFWKLIDAVTKTISDLFRDCMKIIRQLVDGDWKSAWKTAEGIFTKFKENVVNTINALKNFLSEFFEWARGLINDLKRSIIDIGNNIKDAFTHKAVFNPNIPHGGQIGTFSMDEGRPIDIPALASGSVIRGGNPFLAVLGDQPSGQTNVETPLSTIEQALENVMNRGGYGGLNPTISLNVDGQEFARLTLQDILQEASRQGYNVEVLGGGLI